MSCCYSHASQKSFKNASDSADNKDDQGGTGTLSPYIHLGGGAGQGRCKKVFIESIF